MKYKQAKAVAEFQKARKLTADMVVWSKTWDAIVVDYGDGKVNASDALLVLKAVIGKVKVSYSYDTLFLFAFKIV